MDIKDRLVKAAQGEMESIVHIGNVVEKALGGDFGAILDALFEGLRTEQIRQNVNSSVSSDRVLGRIEMSTMIIEALEQYVLDKDNLLQESRTVPDKSLGMSEEPTNK